MSAADLIFAAGPILLLIFWMTKKTPMPSAKALPLAALVAYGIRLAWFGTGANLVNASVLEGLLVALTPILIVWGAIFFRRAKGRKIGICGQAPSDYPEFAQFLVEQGIDSTSLNPDTVLKTTLAILATERAATSYNCTTL